MGMAQNLLSYMWGHEHPLRNDAQQDFIIMPARFDKSKLMETLKHGQNHGKKEALVWLSTSITMEKF